MTEEIDKNVSDESTDVVSATKKEVCRKPMSQERLDQLAIAREKAVAKRRELGELTRREKAVKEEVLNQRIASLASLEKKPITKKAPKKVESETDESSESECEPEPKLKLKSKQPLQSRTRPQTQSLSTPQLTAEMARRELQLRVQRETYQSAFQSLFPGNTLQF